MFATAPAGLGLSWREFTMLRAIAAGRGEITGSCEPDLFIDGLACCDQSTARHLAHSGLVHTAHPAGVGQRVLAELTIPGHALLATLASMGWPTSHARTVHLHPSRPGAPPGSHPGKQTPSTEVTATRNSTTVRDQEAAA